MIWNTISQFPIAWWINVLWWVNPSDILFNGINFLDCSQWVYIDETNWDDINQINLKTYNAPQTDWWGFLSNFIRGKTINMRLVIVADTLEWLNDKMWEIRKRLAVRNSILSYKVNGEFREAEVNLQNLTFNRDYKNDKVQGNVQATFRAMNFFHSSVADGYYENIQTNLSNFDIENEWEVWCDYSLHLIFAPWNSGIDNIKIHKDWYIMEINQVCNDWDVLVIDWIEKEIIYNNNPTIDYEWPFVPLNIWSNPMQLEINWTVNVDVTFVFNKNYL